MWTIWQVCFHNRMLSNVNLIFFYIDTSSLGLQYEIYFIIHVQFMYTRRLEFYLKLEFSFLKFIKN